MMFGDVLLLFYFLRLPVQTVSYEQILGTETVLEGSETWRQQHHRCRAPQQTSRMCRRCFRGISLITERWLAASFPAARCWPGEEAEWIWEPQAAGNRHPVWKRHPGVSSSSVLQIKTSSQVKANRFILHSEFYVLGSSSRTTNFFLGWKWKLSLTWKN